MYLSNYDLPAVYLLQAVVSAELLLEYTPDCDYDLRGWDLEWKTVAVFVDR